MKVLIQLRSTPAVRSAARDVSAAPTIALGVQRGVEGFVADPIYAPVALPRVRSLSGTALTSLDQPISVSSEPESSTYLIRGTIPDGPSQAGALAAANAHPDVVGVFSDPLIESAITCGSTPAVGTVKKVGGLLSWSTYSKAKLNGSGVYLAIVDSGINVAYLKSKGVTTKLDATKSFTPQGVATQPGAHPVHHGTMCTYDASIMAGSATFLDHAVLLSTTPGGSAMAGLLSDAVRSYSQLLGVLNAVPAAKRRMVVSNSWGMFSPTWDFPPGHPSNYSDNPNHPFNLIVAALEAAGADILFAAGNCGKDCPDGRCAFGTTLPICGANSHPAVLSIAGVDTTKARVGYSSQGPGRLTAKKPDVATYTHFSGSGVWAVDSGTSAACPVAAGVIAAIRTAYPASKLSPAQLRSLVQRTAEDRGGTGYDYDYGWGILNPTALKAALP